MARRVLIAAGATVALLLGAAGAGAQVADPSALAASQSPPLVVFYAPVRAPDEVGAARAVLERVARGRGTAVIDVSPLSPPPSEAERHLAAAIEAYHGFEEARAARAIESALSEAERTGAAGLGPDQLGDVYIYGALIADARGESALAWERWVQAATLDPTRRLDPVRFPPRVVESFERAVRAVADGPRASVRIEAALACALALDARPVQAGEVVRVVRGRHYVHARCPGHPDYGARFLVGEDEFTVRPVLVPAQPPTSAEVRELAGRRGADAVIAAVVTITPGVTPTLSLALFDVPTGRERGRVFAGLAALAGEPTPERAEARGVLEQALANLIDRVVSGPYLPVTEPGGPRPAPADTPWYRRPWVWGVTGAAVGAAILLPFVLDGEPAQGFDVRLRGELP